MNDRLYYADPLLSEFDAQVSEIQAAPRPAIILERTAFYPTSGGQVFDTGWLEANGARMPRIRTAAVHSPSTATVCVRPLASAAPTARP